MNLSAPFIRRPAGTVLLTLGLALVGILAFFKLPVAPLPQVDFPTISVSASLSGASPETMASSIATPLERRLGVISDVTEMTSESSTGSTRITLQFALDRDIDGAAREVQAAINAARADLPATLKSNPTYNKRNPANMPVLMLALTSDTKTPGQIYEAVSNVVTQRLAQVEGVGEVEIGGGSLPAVRIEAKPFALNAMGLSMEDVRAAIEAANANQPKGTIDGGGGKRWQVYTDRIGRDAAGYGQIVVAWRNNAPVRLSDVATVSNSVSDTRTLGLFNGKPAVVVLITQQPGANLIKLVDSIRAELPALQAQLPADVHLEIANDRTSSIRSSLEEIEITLVLSVILVVLVVAAFLRDARATFIPAAATIVSLLGTFAVMWLLGYSLNNLSLMAIIVATGFVVDDAIVVLENTARHLEAGMGRMEAALLGAREVGFTVLSISVSLVAVFIPLLFMGGQVGRLFQEFAITLSVAVLISLVLSLTATPMMCAWLLSDRNFSKQQGRIGRAFERGFDRIQRGYAAALDWALALKPLVMLVLGLVIALTVYLYVVVPKGYFPEQDSPMLMAGVRADESVSFTAMQKKLRQVIDIIHADPAVQTAIGFTGGARAGGAFMAVSLKPKSERKEAGSVVIARLKQKLAPVTGISVFLRPSQDLMAGGRSSNSSYQYTLISDNGATLNQWATKLGEAMKQRPELTSIDSDQSQNGVETYVTIDRDSAQRLGISARDVDNALYNAFGQRQVATIYEDINQYGVILEWDQSHAQGPNALKDVYVPAGAAASASASDTTSASTSGGTLSSGATSQASNAQANTADSSDNGVTNPGLRDPSTGSALSTSATAMVPLEGIARFAQSATASSISHENGELATTISFDLASGYSLSDAQAAIKAAEDSISMPSSVRGSFAGTAQSYSEQLGQQPYLILAALVVIYIVLGMLYESLIHPITVLSTLPAAGVGAVLALLLFGMEFSIIALIGVFLLLGIVKKNAILIIDFALHAQRDRGLSAEEAVREASLLRFRPILMTTLAAALGVVPLAIGIGEGSELRQPLGITIIGGLILSQLLTLITTPVVYIYLDKLTRRRRDRRAPASAVQPA
ncbi:efflux RND transporter permease subunit [Sphingomonas sp. PL-96]|uniref:efflux RND transporter permease subunit n=1 Tax=Sphingomonas sp. PL-96 TaxID=2887201 RepID=UPI001E5D5B73|nr:efflux RND transporter permease subunit [Sphingomonas sp. PL-96]MCC2976575.1 efflux RND transporter permease subunit [Sphingomonas sp. PL-96]